MHESTARRTRDRWIGIPGFEGVYEISESGRVRSLDRRDAMGRVKQGQFIRTPPGSSGYPVATLTSRDGTKRTYLIHRLLMKAFTGPCPEGMEVRHLDGDRSHCELSNLAYGTHSENMRDKRLHGTDRYGLRDGCSKGHKYDVANLRVDLHPDGSLRERVCRRCDNERYQPRPPGTAICARCGQVYRKSPGAGQGKRKYCSPSCARAVRRAAQNAKRAAARAERQAA